MMRHLPIGLSLPLLLLCTARAQEIEPEWVHFERGASYYGTTDDGRIVMVGSSGRIVALDLNGTIVDERQVGTENRSIAAAEFMPNGDVIVVGQSAVTSEYVQRLDPDGATVWEFSRQHSYGPVGFDRLKRLSNGAVIATGYWCWGWHGCSSPQKADLSFLLPNGQFLWAWTSPGTGRIQYVGETPDGGVVVLGDSDVAGCVFSVRFSLLGEASESCIKADNWARLWAVGRGEAGGYIVAFQHSAVTTRIVHLDAYGVPIEEGPEVQLNPVNGIARSGDGGYILLRDGASESGGHDLLLELVGGDGTLRSRASLDMGGYDIAQALVPLAEGEFLVAGRIRNQPGGFVSRVKVGVTTSSEADQPWTKDPALSVYPNPTSGSLTISHSTVGTGPLMVEVFDARGARVHTLKTADAGVTTKWDGSDEEGRPVPAGVYIIRTTRGHQIGIGKAVVVR